MRRRCFLLTAICAPLSAQTNPEMVKLFESVAAALSEGNRARFLGFIDPAMENYARLAVNVAGLINQNDVASSIEFLRDEGDSKGRELELDWSLEIRTKENTGIFVRRRETVRCRVEKRKRDRWMIVALTPIEFFAPPR